MNTLKAIRFGSKNGVLGFPVISELKFVKFGVTNNRVASTLLGHEF